MSPIADFVFQLPTRVQFGVGAADRVADEVAALGGARPLIVADPGIIEAGLVEPIEARLKEAGLASRTFSQFSPNPRDHECYQGLKISQVHRADSLVAVGGGSSLDMAKAIGALMTNGGDPVEYAGFDLVKRPLPPLVAIPTTSGTGSEVTFCYVVTDTSERIKVNCISPLLAPAVALVDPLMTRSAPPAATAATGMDAFCHAFESYTCTLSNVLTEGLALQAMASVGRCLKRAVDDGGDIEARAHLQLASTMAGIAFTNSDCCAVHCLAESLGGMVELPHGAACAIFLPYVFEFNMDADFARHARVGQVLGLDLAGLSDEQAATRTLEHIRIWTAELGIPRLKDIAGVDPDEFGFAAEGAMKNLAAGSQPKTTTAKDYKHMLDAAYSA